jgi:putative transposase
MDGSTDARSNPLGSTAEISIRDNDIKYGRKFKYVPESSGIKDINTSVRAPRANAICERFIGTLKLDCLDHYLILHERQLRRVVGEFVAYYNDSRPHQGIDQVVPNRFHEPRPSPSNKPEGSIVSEPVRRGLHRSYSYATTIH